MASQPAHEGAPDATGLLLKDAILIALKDGQEHPSADVLACLEDPGEPAPTRADRRAQFSRTVQELLAEGRITLTGGRPDETGPDAVLHLVPPKPDDRFEIDPIFRDLLPPPSPGELSELERQILRQGCRDPLITWTHEGGTVLIDGHTRLTICLRHHRPYQLSTQKLRDREAVVAWIWAHHYARRNFTAEAQSYARGRCFHAQKLGHGGDRRGGKSKGYSATSKRSARAIAAQFKVERATVFRDAAFAKALDRIEAQMKRLVADLLAGKKVILSTVVQTMLRLALPQGKPAEQADVLIERLGLKDAGG